MKLIVRRFSFLFGRWCKSLPEQEHELQRLEQYSGLLVCRAAGAARWVQQRYGSACRLLLGRRLSGGCISLVRGDTTERRTLLPSAFSLPH